jgi:hypothetical protein
VKPRAYMHIGEEADRPYAQKLIPRLELQGFAVPGIERLDTMPRASEVRYFRKQEADGAALVVAALRRYGVNDAIVRYVRGYEDSKKLRSCHYEIWFSEAAF